MEPYTASNIKVRPKNVIKDFVHIAGLMKVSHLAMFTKTTRGPYLKLGRFPRGPTITFSIENYVLGKDVRSSLKRQVTYAKQYAHHALLIMNNFGGNEEGKSLELVESMFQNMFPSINPNKVKVNSIRRCVLLNCNKDTKLIDFWHYTIKLMPVGLNRGVKKIVTSKVPNLGRCSDMGDFIEGRGGGVSESEAEEDDASHVTTPAGVGVRGVVGGATSSVRLVELGPRMSLRLVKIEEGLLDGEILHHEFVEKTEEEKKEIRESREKRKREKEKRRKEQDKNVKKKKLEREDHKNKSLEGMKKKENEQKSWQGEKALKKFEKEQHDGPAPAESSDDDDAAYYEQEVGQKPDKDLFSKRSKPAKAFDGGKRFKAKKESKHTGFKKRPERDNAKGENDKTKKRKTKVFNTEGVGPSFKKGSGKDKLRRIKSGKVMKKRRK